LVVFISTLLFAHLFYLFFVVKNNAVQYRSNVKWHRLIWATVADAYSFKMTELCLKLKVLAKIDFIAFLTFLESNEPEIWGVYFSRPSTSFCDIIFQMASSSLI